MASDEYTSSASWSVPSHVDTVAIACHGAAGNGGSANVDDQYPAEAAAGGGSGGKATGDLDVSNVDTLYIRFPDGGSGPSASADNTSASGGNGGRGADVRVGGTGQSAVVIAAGGGGGGGGAGADHEDASSTANAGSGGSDGSSGGSASADAGSYGGTASASGGGASTQSGMAGANGASEELSAYPGYGSAAGGGGGGGLTGGGGGGADAIVDTTYGAAAAAGGGGGGGCDTSGVANSTHTQGGSESSGGKVTLTYDNTPAAPDNTTQTVTGDGSADQSWDADTSGGSLDHYDLEVSTDGGAWTSVDDSIQAGTTSYSHTFAASVDTVQYRVRAVNSDGASAWSTTAAKSTNITSVTLSNVTADAVDVDWDAADDVQDYDVLLAEASGSTAGDYAVDQTVAAGTTTTTITGLENGERYYVRVVGRYPNADALSPEAAATTPLPNPTLDSLDAQTEGEITLAITLPDNSTDGDALVEHSTDGGSSWQTTATLAPDASSYTHAGLLDGNSYTYRVTWRTDHAEGQSGTLTATTILPALSDLAVVDGSVTSDQATVEVHDNANNKGGYRAYLGPDGYLESSGLDGGYVEVSDDAALDVGGQLTVAIELKPTALDVTSNNDYRVPFGNNGYQLFLEEAGRLHVSHWIDGSRIFGGSITNLDVGERVNVVYTVDATTGDWVGYVGGSQVASGTYGTTGTIDESADPLTLFGAGGGHNFAGPIYRVTVDDRVWSASEASNYADGGTPADPVAHFELNQGSGSTAVDYSGNGLDGTLYGSPTWHGGGAMTQRGDLTDTVPEGETVSYTYTGLRDGEQYVTRMSIYTEDAGEVFDN